MRANSSSWRGLRGLLALAFAAAFAWASPVSAGPPDPSPPTDGAPSPTQSPEASPPPAEDEAPPALDWTQQRAADIDALLEGTLGPEVDADALLVFDLGRLSPAARALILGRLGRDLAPPEPDPPKDEPPSPPPAGEDESQTGTEAPTAKDPLVDALRGLFALPPELLRSKLDAHRAAHQAWRSEQREREQLQDRITGWSERARLLQELRSGELDAETDPSAAFEVDLLAVEATALEPGEAEPAPPSAELEAARAAWLAELEATFAAPDEQRAAWLEAHRNKENAEVDVAEAKAEAQAAVKDAAREEAERAAAERAAALAAAEAARDERARARAQMRADLLGVREAQARYEEQLAKDAETRSESHARILQLLTPVDELLEKRGGIEDRADARFPAVDRNLGEIHDALTRRLNAVPRSRPAPHPGDPPAEAVATDELDALHAELEARAAELDARYATWRNEAVTELREDAQALNAARLGLLTRASGRLQSDITGFGPAGVRSFERELRHIVLLSRLQAQRLPRWLAQLRSDLETSPVPVIWVIFKLFAALFVFRWWRRRAPDGLRAVRERLARRNGAGARLMATGVWYLERIRKPVEWFALIAFALGTLQTVDGTPDLALIWLAAFWVTAGLTIISWVDALAARQGRAHADQEDTSALRIRSLRIVGLTIVLTGLIMSATSSLVGNGTIHAWVWRSTWMLSLPVALLIIHWWQPFIFARIQREREPGPVAEWVLARQKGMVRFIAATVGGVHLLAGGVRRWTLRQASTVEVTRRLLAFMFRREVARQADADDETSLEVIGPETVKALWVPTGVDAGVWHDELDALISTVSHAKNTLSCVVGERGLGKSTFTRVLGERLMELTPEERILYIECPKGDFAQLLGALAVAVGLQRHAAPEEVAAAVAAHENTTIVIDDLHRIVRPALDGLAELDKFAAFVRESGDTTAWVGCFDAPAWQYVRRARGDRVFFDSVVELPRWSEERIGTFLTERTVSAQLDVDFEHLKLPRRFDDGELDEAQRNQQAFMRILWDSAHGNPTVALELWCRSLVRDARGRVRARLPSDARYRELDQAEIGVYFVLRALVQLDVATIPEIGDCTRIRVSEVADAMRFVQSRELVERDGDTYRVALHAYRPVRNLLRRQNLLAV